MTTKEYIDARIAAILSRVVMKGTKKDGIRLTAQTDDGSGDVLDDVPFFQNYGFASIPKDETQAIAVNLSGSRENQVIISTDSGEFILEQLESGEVAFFHPGTEDFFQFKNDGTISLKTKTLNFEGDFNISGALTAAEARIEGDINGGNITSESHIKDAAGTLNGLRTEYKVHTHAFTPPAGPNGPPIAPPAP